MNRFIATITPTFSQASCKQHDNNIWFDTDTQEQAVTICQTCPELDVCRTYALSLPVDTEGVFAGLTAKQLKPLRKQNGNPPIIDHGTINGYTQHRRYGIPACDACLRANANYKVDRFAKYRETRKQKNPGTFEHGTASGYTKHYLYGIPVCDDCKKAKAEYMRQYKTKQ